jgi:hypothetical protein
MSSSFVEFLCCLSIEIYFAFEDRSNQAKSALTLQGFPASARLQEIGEKVQSGSKKVSPQS